MIMKTILKVLSTIGLILYIIISLGFPVMGIIYEYYKPVETTLIPIMLSLGFTIIGAFFFNVCLIFYFSVWIQR